MTFFESDIKLSYISSSGVCVVDQGKTPLAPSNMIFFGASLKSPTPCFEDIINISASSSSVIIFILSFLFWTFCFSNISTLLNSSIQERPFFSSVIWLSNDFQFQINQNNTKFRIRISNWYIPWPSFLKIWIEKILSVILTKYF